LFYDDEFGEIREREGL